VVGAFAILFEPIFQGLAISLMCRTTFASTKNARGRTVADRAICSGISLALRMSKVTARRNSGSNSPRRTAMKRNEGTLDRTVRILLGLALLALVFVGPKSWLGLVGLVPLATGLVGFCPLYRLIGVRTRPTHS
jgi:hypothetical protein